MDQLELAYDHYKDTFSYIKEAEKDRNKLFVIVALLLAGLYLFAIEPNSMFNIIKEILKEYKNMDIGFNFLTIQTLLWIVLLFYTIRYFQINTYINRQYDYLHTLEKSIDDIVEIRFNREGKGYLGKYPKFLDLVYYLYTLIFPLIYILVVGYKIICEWINIGFSLSIALNTLIALCIIVATILYLELIHSKEVKVLRNIFLTKLTGLWKRT